MKDSQKKHHESTNAEQEVISFDRCRSLHKRKEKELRSRALVGSLIAGLVGFWLGYTFRDRAIGSCPVPGAIPATLSSTAVDGN